VIILQKYKWITLNFKNNHENVNPGLNPTRPTKNYKKFDPT
jgi:hypothetical protein